MNAKKMLALIFVLALVATVAPTASAQSSWDQAICDGSEGYVFRTVDGTTSSLDAETGCEPSEDLAWLVVEPWNRDQNVMNPDRACLASDWASVVATATRMDWTEGSIWRVSTDLGENPLVVDCALVETNADLGLNPGEGQVELRLLRATTARANELLDEARYTRAAYIAEYGDTPISELFSLIDLFSMGNN